MDKLSKAEKISEITEYEFENEDYEEGFYDGFTTCLRLLSELTPSDFKEPDPE